MKFGLFYELQLPKPYDKETWNPEDEHRIVQEMLEQVELADRLGFDYVFEVEHHFLEEYSHSSAPEVVLAAASQRTKQIRLGHGIVHMPPGHNHPARTAERVATLDLVSGGRVEFGTGEGASDMEFGGFNTDRSIKKRWLDSSPVINSQLVAWYPAQDIDCETGCDPFRIAGVGEHREV